MTSPRIALVASLPSVLAAAVLTASPLSGAAQTSGPGDPADGTFAAWVALYDPTQIGWLENANRIQELCPDTTTLDRCYAEALAPALMISALFAEPSEGSRRVGELIIAAVPGTGLSAYFASEGGRDAALFIPDLTLADWGYGPPYFHQTFADREGAWFQLPAGPWPGAAWLRRPNAAEEGLVLDVRAGEILELDGSSFYVIVAERDALVLRTEQPADQWCEPGDPPTLTPDSGSRWTRDELLDPLGHLRFTPKYLKGC